ncbi:hypothetical protein [Glutamicibacter sp. BW80]|uniref:hypothetical protein n=1 Tax=Glutamicibacter sp. BW80 TaxID=2024404 RepID=UPI00159690FA|nr:hypothetical protein [Glutamicibacter sp. BW80]
MVPGLRSRQDPLVVSPESNHRLAQPRGNGAFFKSAADARWASYRDSKILQQAP